MWWSSVHADIENDMMMMVVVDGSNGSGNCAADWKSGQLTATLSIPTDHLTQ